MRQALDSGVSPNEKFTVEMNPQHDGMTPLALAAALNKVEAVKVGLNQRLYFELHNNLFIYYFIIHCDINCFTFRELNIKTFGVFYGKLLLTYEADVNDTFASLKTTALMTSSFHGHSEIVRALLKKGANVRAIDLQGSTALGYAFGGKYGIRAIKAMT